MKKLVKITLALFFGCFMLFSGIFPAKRANAINYNVTFQTYSVEIQEIFDGLGNYKNRIAGSSEERDAANYIVSYLNNYSTGVEPINDTSTENGIQTFKFVSNFTGLYQTSQNIIYRYSAAQSTNKRVIICCHYDVPVHYDEDEEEYVSYNNDALNSSAANVAAVLMLSRYLSGLNLNFNIDFVFFGAGESSHAGSEFYVDGISTKEKKNILCSINLDTVALGTNLYFYQNEIQTSFSKYLTTVLNDAKLDTKQIDLVHLNKTGYYDELGLGYGHIALLSDNVNFMKQNINCINMFAGNYEKGIVFGRCEYENKDTITYSEHDSIDYINTNFGTTEISDNLFKTFKTIETILSDKEFVSKSTKSFGETNWFYSIFANENLAVCLTAIAFVVMVIVAMVIYYKLTIKSYYANIEVEFLSSVVKITEQIDSKSEDKNVPKIISQVIANDIKKDKTLKPEKDKKNDKK